MKRLFFIACICGLFFVSTSFTSAGLRSCTSYTETGYVIEKLNCYYRVDLGFEIRLVPSGGITLSPGQCYTFSYDFCGIQCGKGGVTSATVTTCP